MERKRNFKHLSIGCFLYALFYTFCLYQNKSGITYPFFIGATLYCFSYFSKKFGGVAKKGNYFLMTALMIIGLLNWTTDSWVLIGLNYLMSWMLLAVLFLHTFHQDENWKIWTYFIYLMKLAGGTIGRGLSWISDGLADRKERNAIKGTSESEIAQQKKKQKSFEIILGICVAIPVLSIIIMLLCSADAVFSQVCENALGYLDLTKIPWNGDVIGYVIYLILIFCLSYGLVNYLIKKDKVDRYANSEGHKGAPTIAITFTGLTAVVYCLFCGIQFVSLLCRALPEGMTYAEYARQGFFQLLFICILNVGIVLVCFALFEKNRVLQILLFVISICTYIMIASSAYRMLLYIAVYHLTFLRVFVLWSLFVIAVLMAGVMWYLCHEGFPLFWFGIVVVTACYLPLCASHPDYWIAKYNVEYLSQGEEVDTYYLFQNLSMDAAPILCTKEIEEASKESAKTYNFHMYYTDLSNNTDSIGIREWNVSRLLAKRQVEKYRNSALVDIK